MAKGSAEPLYDEHPTARRADSKQRRAVAANGDTYFCAMRTALRRQYREVQMASIYAKLKESETEMRSLVEKTSATLVKASKENRGMTPAEDAAHTAQWADIDRLRATRERLTQQLAIEGELNSLQKDSRKAGREDVIHSTRSYAGPKDAQQAYAAAACTRSLPAIHGGFSTRSADGRFVTEDVLSMTGDTSEFAHQLVTGAPGDYEYRALGGTTVAGDYTIPQSFFYNLEVALKWTGGPLQAGEIITTDDGRPAPYPSVNDVGNVAEVTAENVSATICTTGTTPADPVFGVVNFGAYLYDSGFVKVPVQLADDSAFNIEKTLMDISGGIADPNNGLLIQRLARKLNTDFTLGLGSGSSQPRGFTLDAALGNTAASTNVVTYNEILDLIYSLDRAYRPTASFMMNDATIKALRKITDSNGRPIWLSAGTAGNAIGSELDTLGGYPVYPNNDVPIQASTNKSIYFGSFSRYKMRLVKHIRVMKLVERFAEFFQTGYMAFIRADGALVDAGTHPIRYLKQSAT